MINTKRAMELYAYWTTHRDDIIRQGLKEGMPAYLIADRMQISVSVVRRIKATGVSTHK